jgi:hypothetical protein
MKYNIWLRRYPQRDVNFSEDIMEIAPVTLTRAKEIIKELETLYNDPDWKGHWLYKARFYPMEAGAPE